MPLRSTKERLRSAEAFVLDQVESYPTNIIAEVERRFGVGRTAAKRLVDGLCERRLIHWNAGLGRPHYQAVRFGQFNELMPVVPGSQEDLIYNRLRPYLTWAPKNVRDICEYAVSEMVNNVLDHSGSDKMYLSLDYRPHKLSISIIDTGVGIFRKVQEALRLEQMEYAILELAKGKFTTCPERHSGEGVFFTSKMVDSFAIISDHLIFIAGAAGGQWLGQRQRRERTESKIVGTAIMLEIDPQTDRTTEQVLNEFRGGEHPGFSMTMVPVRLADLGEASFISRSQAKRLLVRFERFREVILDFKDVPQIGPSFADEVFRVFQASHPQTRIRYINASDSVEMMIQRALAGDAAANR